jgi:hypothetical protein
MAQINARDWVFEVSEDPSGATPVWAEVGGLESFDLNNSEGEESTETTTFASGGNAESQAMQRGASLSLTGKVVTADPGQASVDALAVLVGDESLGGVRFRHTSETDWTVWTAWVSKGNNGGGTNDKTSWSASFTRSGAATTEVVV